jgi:hypothetical protein
MYISVLQVERVNAVALIPTYQQFTKKSSKQLNNQQHNNIISPHSCDDEKKNQRSNEQQRVDSDSLSKNEKSSANQSQPSKSKKSLPKRKEFPQFQPQICICVLSCNRLNLLEQTLASIINHMENDEPNVKYEIVWVDNGSDKGIHNIITVI